MPLWKRNGLAARWTSEQMRSKSRRLCSWKARNIAACQPLSTTLGGHYVCATAGQTGSSIRGDGRLILSSTGQRCVWASSAHQPDGCGKPDIVP